MGRYACSSLNFEGRVEGSAAEEEGSRTRWYREGGWFTPPREWAAATAEPREAAAVATGESREAAAAAAAAREEAAAREAARASFHATDGIAS